MPLSYKLLGKNIRDVRRSLNITQDELAQRTGLSMNHISHVEVGSTTLSLPALIVNGRYKMHKKGS